jgi:hypothetical protein
MGMILAPQAALLLLLGQGTPHGMITGQGGGLSLNTAIHLEEEDVAPMPSKAYSQA